MIMILKKALPRRRLSTLAILVLPAAMILGGVGYLHATDMYNYYERRPVVLDNAPPDADAPRKAHEAPVNADRGSSALWRSAIWESFPVEQLSGPDNDPVSEAYQQTGWKPFFIDPHFNINEQGKTLLGRLRGLESEAIDPKPFKLDELAAGIEKLDRSRAALKAADPKMKDTRADDLSAPQPLAQQSSGDHAQTHSPANTAELLSKYRDTFLAAGEVDSRLAAALFLYEKEMNPSGRGDIVKALAGEISMANLLQNITPAHYDSLVSAYARYKELAAQGRQQPVAFSGSLRPGETGNHIRDIQKRLQQENIYQGPITGAYDAETQRAMKQFQIAHQIDPDGVIGQKTKDWLNVSFQEKADMIAYAMKTLRQSPVRNHENYIRVNIPQFVLEYYRDGKLSEAHRVVVGKASGKKVKYRGRMVGENQTPTLSSTIEQVILNPRWYVGDRISLELNAEAKSDPEYFTKHGYVQMNSLYPWGQPRMFQRSGPKNALGRVKFEFPNVYAVYMHDTPMKSLFQRSRRDFSHGCIRVEKALELAQTILKDDSSSYAQKISSIIEGDRQTFVKLSQPIPISIEYIPVVPDDKGRIIFLGDPYGILKDNGNQKG